jgi:ferrous iron transport protein B
MSHFNFGGACDIQDSFLAKICFVLKYIFYPMGINDWRAAFASLSGFVAKENIAGMLAVLYPEGMSLPLPSSIAYLTFVMLIPPCVSAVTSCKNELGRRTAYGYACTQTIFAFLCSYIVYFLLSGGAGLALVILICLGIYLILLKNKHERIYNHRKNKFKRIH